ncbi:hypothetical protein OG874_12165 [Nocardia sp. NBC_00565]|uniref:hypothetical protein n=1 Tax=Nocardia sp. NBC_00565 TaxID=2975993 RepID=UPI002E80CA18|nr:hypothetical protein [Nocardia sp. NBC_00565]WUC05840.1 hypothetical protein OG874_12165 [Nocardia sp. NBC_00565]
MEFTASDVEMLRLMTGYVDDGALDEPDSLRLARMLSQSISQLARLQVEILADQSARAGRHDDATELARHVPQRGYAPRHPVPLPVSGRRPTSTDDRDHTVL